MYIFIRLSVCNLRFTCMQMLLLYVRVYMYVCVREGYMYVCMCVCVDGLSPGPNEWKW